MSLRRPLPRQIVGKETWLELPCLAAHSYLPSQRNSQGIALRPQQPPPCPKRIIPGTLQVSTLGKSYFARYPPPYQHPHPQQIIPGTAGFSQHIIHCTAQGS